MKIIKRNNCVSCGGKLQDIHCVKNFPIYMGTTLQDKKDDLEVDMIFSKCKICDCIQMRNLIPLDILYKNSHHAGATGKSWLHHHKEFSKFVTKHAYGDIVEIGGSHLILANHVQESENINNITVYDTNITGEAISDKIKTVKGLFNHTTVKSKPDAIVHSHVIEHLYNPIKEIKEMTQLLEEGKTMIISAPVIDKMMEDGFTNAMNFEHTYGLTKKLLYKILNKSQLEIIEEYDYSRHCVFVAAKKNSSITTNIRTYDSSFFDKFLNYQNIEIQRINNLLSNPKETFVFGAHIFTQFLLKNGLKESNLLSVLDNDANKQGQRLYGTKLNVDSPKVLKNFDCPTVILKAGQYTQEIKNDILQNINSKTRFIL